MAQDNQPRRPAPWREADRSDPVFYTADRRRDDDECDTPRRGGILRNNRGLVITLLDVVFVTILSIFFLVFLRPLSERVSIPPYRIETETIRQEGSFEIRASVEHRTGRFGNTDDDTGLPAPQPIVTVSAFGYQVSDLAPRPGTVRIIRLTIPVEVIGEDETAAGTIRIGEVEKELPLKLR